ncbi:MAG: TetR/AcrR family transcriptional regulator [Prolixibacteraceae bacterium]
MNTDLSNRQLEIINVSLELIAEKGIQGLTIKNLAKKIGFSESAIYRHFDNKIQILIGVLNHFEGISEQFFKQEMENDADSITKIEHLFLLYFNTFSMHPSIVAVIFSEEIFRNETVLLEKVAEVMKGNSSKIIEILEKGQRKGEVRFDIIPSHLAIIILGSLRMFVSQWHLSRYSYDISEKGSDFIQSIKTLIST